MGEFAYYKREKIKIGTCEILYYLRYDQLHLITPDLPNNVDPTNPEQAKHLFFRFPFPWEDRDEPGSFEPFRACPLPGYTLDDEADHGSKQFRADGGYLLCLPCPESKAFRDLTEKADIHAGHNGYSGSVHLAYQKPVGDELQAVVKCNGCGHLWRLDAEDAAKAAEGLRKAADEAERYGRRDDRIGSMRQIANRIMSGYSDKKPSTPATDVAH